ncbi:biotin synthase BioB [Austwickia chelonae]|uniref:biotin synthase BioB n=1 Tax=Austwickia chelonae TaxID=100225 RepID=UPI000E280979|nr:biotin synthase BioB [Austwickia chelonae]
MVKAGLAGRSITRAQAMAVLASGDDDLMSLVAAASQVRRKHFGRRMKLNYLINLKSGMCPEDCHYCSQSLGSEAGVLKYSWLGKDEASAAAAAGVAGGARRVCLVASGRGPSNREVEKVAGIIEGIKADNPEVEVCACLGFVTQDQARRLHEAGADAYNHNLNTAESAYEEICSTHTYADREATVEAAHAGGLSACSGLIAGMGESDEQLIEVVFALREIGADSVPVNFLLPFEGTPLQGHLALTPQRCLRILAMVRFVHPDTEVRAAAGREYHLRSLQPLALEISNSIFLGDYLTSEGQAGAADLQMIADLGFTIEGGGTPEEILEAAAAAAHGQVHGVAEGHAHVVGQTCGSAEGGGCGGSGSCGGSGGCGGGGGHSHGDGHGHGHGGEEAAVVEPPKDCPSRQPVSGPVPVTVGSEPPSVQVRRRGVGTELPPNA